MTLFSAVALAPRDPILGPTEQFAADPNLAKVNLGVGMYYDEDGKPTTRSSCSPASRSRTTPITRRRDARRALRRHRCQQGMFSGLTREQMQRLRAEFGVHGVDSGRVCVAALNTRNIDHAARSIAAVR